MHQEKHINGLIGGEIHFDNFFQFILDIFKHAVIITVFVLIMMLLIEYITIQTKGKWSKPFSKNPWMQVLFAALMGITPGCLGVYIIVSLYAHRILNFAALVTAMIATFGDEAFVMFAMIPSKTLVLMGSIFSIAMCSGLLLNLFPAGKSLMYLPVNHLLLHDQDPDCVCFQPSLILPQLKKISFERAMLLTVGLFFIIFLINGEIGPSTWDWKKIIFLLVALIEVFIVATVPDHFLRKHLWDHVIKKHLLKIFLWTFGAFLIIHLGLELLNLDHWLQSNIFTVLIIAILVGLIPESGPHMVFITLFANSSIPFSILLANSIVQDGHGALPLLAESRKSFLYMKGINALIGFLIGLTGLLTGF